MWRLSLGLLRHPVHHGSRKLPAPALPPRSTAGIPGVGAPAGSRAAAAQPEPVPLDRVRNVAIIAHVDHGKTTLVDQLMKQSGMGMKVTERMLDSKDLEQERGITIMSKATRINWGGYLFNIVDTPGHADFGGEVERVLSMVDGVVLLVDCVEGPKAQTKFVLRKALAQAGMKPLVVINKVDRPQERDPGEVENEIFDVFASMTACEEQLDYPTLYASGKAGFCANSLEEARSASRPTNMMVLYEAIRDHVPPPKVLEVPPEILSADEKGKGFSMLVSQLDRLPALGPTVTGKVFSGQVQKGDRIYAKNLDGEQVATGRVKEVTIVQGVSREPTKCAVAGDIVAVSVTGFMPKWTQTLVSHPKMASIACTPIDPPVLSLRASVNDSPLCGRDGKYITLNAIGERLGKECATNPAIEVVPSPMRDYFEIRGRGEMQLGILIEEMRREGYEMSLSPPDVVKTINEEGQVMEPWEDVTIDVHLDFASHAVERLNSLGANVHDIQTVGQQQTLKCEIATMAFLGFRSWLRELTGGTAMVVAEFKEMRRAAPPPLKGRHGSLISSQLGTANPIDLSSKSKLGTIFIPGGAEVYPGMIFGESFKDLDVETNISKPYKPIAGQGKTDKGVIHFHVKDMKLEQAIGYIQSDEKVEVTPKRVTLRKALLDPAERKAAMKKERSTKANP
mmetsp:Transcript_13921/g.39628  ORF Transcript_13921/g.39628 Transcript_13921/m.39628 type:complete len:679 (-) Transcript_13921:719-2755(-)